MNKKKTGRKNHLLPATTNTDTFAFPNLSTIFKYLINNKINNIKIKNNLKKINCFFTLMDFSTLARQQNPMQNVI